MPYFCPICKGLSKDLIPFVTVFDIQHHAITEHCRNVEPIFVSNVTQRAINAQSLKGKKRDRTLTFGSKGPIRNYLSKNRSKKRASNDR